MNHYRRLNDLGPRCGAALGRGSFFALDQSDVDCKDCIELLKIDNLRCDHKTGPGCTISLAASRCTQCGKAFRYVVDDPRRADFGAGHFEPALPSEPNKTCVHRLDDIRSDPEAGNPIIGTCKCGEKFQLHFVDRGNVFWEPLKPEPIHLSLGISGSCRCGKEGKSAVVTALVTCPECLRLNKEDWMKYLFDETPKINPESPEPRGTLTIS